MLEFGRGYGYSGEGNVPFLATTPGITVRMTPRVSLMTVLPIVLTVSNMSPKKPSWWMMGAGRVVSARRAVIAHRSTVAERLDVCFGFSVVFIATKECLSRCERGSKGSKQRAGYRQGSLGDTAGKIQESPRLALRARGVLQPIDETSTIGSQGSLSGSDYGKHGKGSRGGRLGALSI